MNGYTKPDPGCPTPWAGPEPASVEITPEMIDAGVGQFLDFGSDEDLRATDPQNVVRWIFEAMAEAGQKSAGPDSQ